ncbi:dNTP triphosphohydrolase, broad substrate specificity [Olavius algarvensis associated proteobacterium Delta 3]|nr:dNTP triphosphohydrolase, broad substrate specificity [Olavius algarvensis associated proteobacterium Delta 3]CAB5158816.1 dNTP triphosphohydrolase, broad substrate specificity [Olavius algarvensis associated proteobacterium Delta 3]
MAMKPAAYNRPRTILEDFEKRERNFMSPFGCLSSESEGRLVPEPACPVRSAFQRDRDRIVYSNAFRRLKHKTQVFLAPLGAHYRTRLTHTLEVAQISRTIARALYLNEDLAEAIALGHDLGHPPFGHGGEMALKEIYSATFSHSKQSIRVVDLLENNGKGLNLTREVRDGILKHSKGYGQILPNNRGKLARTVEGRIVRIADIMAYLNHDLDDAIRSGVIQEGQVPGPCVHILGRTHSDRATTMIQDLIFSTTVVGDCMQLRLSDDVAKAMSILRKFLYENVYRSWRVHKEFVKAKKILKELFQYFLENERMRLETLEDMEMPALPQNGDTPERTVCDMIASLTDTQALGLYSNIFFPSPHV